MLVRVIFLLGNDLRLPVEFVLDPIEERPGRGFIRKEMTQPWKAMAEGIQEQWGSDAIHNVGCMNLHGQQKSLRINQQMPFATPDFL